MPSRLCLAIALAEIVTDAAPGAVNELVVRLAGPILSRLPAAIGSYKLTEFKTKDDRAGARIAGGVAELHEDCITMAKKEAKEDKEPQPQAAAGPKRILLVDDDAEIIESMRYALEAKGFQIFIARDGNQGLAMAEREDPDLVILDMMMPKRSGFLVLEKLRRTRPVPVRVIMITANEGSRHKAYAEMLGVDDYIRKPFAMDKLVEACSGCWRRVGAWAARYFAPAGAIPTGRPARSASLRRSSSPTASRGAGSRCF